MRENRQKFYDARSDVNDRQRGIYVTDDRMAFTGAAVELRPRPLMMACAERRAKSTTERTNTRTTESTEEFQRFPMRIIIPRDAEKSTKINTSSAKNARSAEQMDETQVIQNYDAQTIEYTDEENIRTSLPVTIGRKPDVRSDVRRTDRPTNQYVAKIFRWQHSIKITQLDTDALQMKKTNGRRQLLRLFTQITPIQNVSNLRRVSSDMSMYDETAERLAMLNSTARQNRLQTGNEIQETPRNTQNNTEELNTALNEATQAVHRLISMTRVNKSAQSNLGTGPRRGSCARRWLA